jgi:hypothetical protein
MRKATEKFNQGDHISNKIPALKKAKEQKLKDEASKAAAKLPYSIK